MNPGFYIHTCQKMRYKGTYAPSELLDTHDNTWHALERVAPLLDAGVRCAFATPRGADEARNTHARTHDEHAAAPGTLSHAAARSVAPLCPVLDTRTGALQTAAVRTFR